MQDQPYEGQVALAPRIYEYVLAGLLLALGSGAAIAYHIYYGFVTEEISRNRAYWGIGLPFVGLAAGLYIFAYGWQRGDVAKAIRMSMWLSLGAIGIIAAVLGTLAIKRNARGGGSFFALGMPMRRRRSGLFWGNSNDNYGSPWPGGGMFGDNQGDSPQSSPDLLTVHCRNCGEMFVPQPPKAICPSCGYSAIANAS
jgi:hypothetical protein